MLPILFISTLLPPPPPAPLVFCVISNQIQTDSDSKIGLELKLHKFVYLRKSFWVKNAHLNAFDSEFKIFSFLCRCFA